MNATTKATVGKSGAKPNLLFIEMLATKGGRSVVEGWAKEDARYAVALATEGRLGFTANARNLELAVRRMREAPLAEVRALGAQLHACAREVVPSLGVLADDEAFPDGIRIARTDAIGTVRYLSDGDHVAAELDASNAVIARYAHGADIDEVLRMERGKAEVPLRAPPAGPATLAAATGVRS